MPLITGRDSFVRNLLESIGVPTHNLAKAAIRIEPCEVVAIDATYFAEKPDDAVVRSFELHRPEPLIAAMSELAGGKIHALEIAEGDVIVFRCPGWLDQAQRARIGEQLERQFGGEHKVLILDGGAELQIVKNELAL